MRYRPPAGIVPCKGTTVPASNRPQIAEAPPREVHGGAAAVQELHVCTLVPEAQEMRVDLADDDLRRRRPHARACKSEHDRHPDNRIHRLSIRGWDDAISSSTLAGKCDAIEAQNRTSGLLYPGRS